MLNKITMYILTYNIVPIIIWAKESNIGHSAFTPVDRGDKLSLVLFLLKKHVFLSKLTNIVLGYIMHTTN